MHRQWVRANRVREPAEQQTHAQDERELHRNTSIDSSERGPQPRRDAQQELLLGTERLAYLRYVALHPGCQES